MAATSIDHYLSAVKRAIDNVPREAIQRVVDALLESRRADKQIFVLGNGGSASTASHFACDLGKGTIMPNAKRFRVISLTDQIPLMTAWANDSSYDRIFVEQLRNLLQEGDLVIGISGSGNSPNVLNALEYAGERGARTVGLTGFDGGKLKPLVDECIVVEADNIEVVEDVHLALNHSICMAIRAETAESA